MASPTKKTKAISFSELIDYGKEHGANIENNMPWSFDFMGFKVTHENDSLYLLTKGNRTKRFETNDMCILHDDGEITIVRETVFYNVFESI